MKTQLVFILLPFILNSSILLAQCPNQAEIISPAVDSVEYCNSIDLKAKAFSSVRYEWIQDGKVVSNNHSLYVLHGYQKPGKYILKMTDQEGCSSYDSVFISSILEATIRPVKPACFPGVQVTADVETDLDDISFSWSPVHLKNATFSDNSKSPFFTFTETGWHSYNGKREYITLSTTASGCTVWDSVGIKLGNDCPEVHELRGYVYRDINNNGVKDSGEPGLESILVTSDKYATITDKDGVYKFFLPPGDYSVTIKAPDYFTSVVPSTGSYELTISHAPVSGADFGLYRESFHDVSVAVAPERARPGLLHKVTASVYNAGDHTENVEITLSSDPGFEFASATDGGIFDPLCNCVKWEDRQIDSGTIKSFTGYFMVPVSVTMGNLALSKAHAFSGSEEYNSSNNVDSAYTTIVNSFDPNDKLVNANPANGNFISRNSILEYMIRFQNTGTDTAYNVVLHDSLDTSLDLTSFEIIGASHDYKVFLRDHFMSVSFSNIMLPDSNTNEPASNGFFKYRIKPLSNIDEGTVIKNRAGIYFDYNDPIYTNTTENIIGTLTLNSGTVSEKSTTYLYPNPAANSVHISSKEKIEKFTLLNFAGQELLTGSGSELSVRECSPGIYLLKIETNGSVELKSLVVR